MKKPQYLAALVLAALSTANLAYAIDDYGSLRGRINGIANGSIDIWGGEPGTDGKYFKHQKQRNPKKKKVQPATTGQVRIGVFFHSPLPPD